MEKKAELIIVDLISKFREASGIGAKEVILFFEANEDVIQEISKDSKYYPFKLNAYFDYGKCLKNVGRYESSYQILTKTLKEYDSKFKTFKLHRANYILDVLKAVVSLCKILKKVEEQRIYQSELSKRIKMNWLTFHFRKLLAYDTEIEILDDQLD